MHFSAFHFILYLNFSVLDLCYLMAERGSEPVVSKQRVSSLCILFLQLSLFSESGVFHYMLHVYELWALCLSHSG